MIIIERIDHISIPVSDLEKSIEFYKEFLGFEIIEKQSGSSEAILQVADVKLRLLQTEEKLDGQLDDNYICLYVDEDDFDDALEEIESNNIEIIYGPENIRNGRKVIIKDLDGNTIGLCS